MIDSIQAQSRSRSFLLPAPVVILWLLILAAVSILISLSPHAWDVAVYRNAIRSLAAGHDPYLDGIARQKLYYNQTVHPAGDPPFSYVYSPVTIPILRVITAFPVWLSGSIYWSIFVVGALAEIWVVMRAVEENERRLFLYLAPITVFFPGLLANGIVLGGNIAYILYGTVLLAAVIGWRRNTWIWFYLAVLVASCIKAPLLSLAVIPLLSARKQWIPTAIASIIGISLFTVTPIIWPDLFPHYLQAIDLQFSFNHDFGCSPAGLFSGFLLDHDMPYFPAGLVFYLGYAIPVFSLLIYFSKRFFAGYFPLQQWMPVLLVGVILLNPRIIEYDVAAITIPLALIVWRFLSTFNTPFQRALWFGIVFVITNCIALRSWGLWKLAEAPFLVFCFAVGCWSLLKLSNSHDEWLERVEIETLQNGTYAAV
ncbi:MAG TPA: hypothetical protein VNW54_10145 [Granulicella sp.]|nr:hypothetical protein [Granulicella sp.]